MTFTIPATLLEHTDYPPLKAKADRRFNSDTIALRDPEMTDAMLEAIHAATTAAPQDRGTRSLAKSVTAMLAARPLSVRVS